MAFQPKSVNAILIRLSGAGAIMDGWVIYPNNECLQQDDPYQAGGSGWSLSPHPNDGPGLQSYDRSKNIILYILEAFLSVPTKGQR